MDLGLAGKNAVVLASSKGLGRAIAGALAFEGANVLLVGRSGDLLESVAAEINQSSSGKADYVTADLSDPDSAEVIEKTALEKLGKIDILVNNTGGPPPGKMSDADVVGLAPHFNTMVMRVMDITARFVPHMKEQGWGRVLTVASSGVEQPIPNLGLSNTLRAALVGWSKSMSNELAGDGLTFNMLLPGRIATDRTKQLDEANAKKSGLPVEQVTKNSIATIPAGRYGDPKEFGSVAAFLCSDKASYITGSMIRCDGGSIKSV